MVEYLLAGQPEVDQHLGAARIFGRADGDEFPRVLGIWRSPRTMPGSKLRISAVSSSRPARSGAAVEMRRLRPVPVRWACGGKVGEGLAEGAVIDDGGQAVLGARSMCSPSRRGAAMS